MRNVGNFAAALLAAAALMGAAGASGEEKPLIIASTRLLIVRSGDTLNGRAMSVDERIGHVQDVFAKHLGGKYAKVTWKSWGDRVHLYLNNDFTLAVTPTDASSTGYKTATQLAPVWVEALKKGFNEAHVQGKGGAS